ncbi:uncharacterized protein topaz1 isoform X4 [Notolabrus celidotus]|uniref:uncharacterized protein topaz1 isoform X4 n=1 Tax=Notolabrus celidotus TaxID=1203425 RepID=UPI00148F4B90|nr:uncharacterized protein topaz1 isoform X4 [Notolabrus celidotus]
MLPSCSRVKLNRVALKHVIGPRLVPRRRRDPGSAVSKKEEETRTETSTAHSSDEPVQKILTDQMCPTNVTDISEAVPEENCLGTKRAKRGDMQQTRTDTERSTHSNPTGPTDSEGSLRRAVKASHCGLCGDCKYISPQRKTLGKPRQKSSGPGPGQPIVDFKLEERKTAPEISQKSVMWKDPWPKVTLCDVVQNFDALSHDCGCMLPDVLKTKVVHCFKQEMRPGFGPGCSDCSEQENKKDAHANTTEKNVCQSKSLTPHDSNITECTDLKSFTNHTPCCFLESWTSEGSATGSASLLLDECTTKRECRTVMKDRNTEQDPGPGYPLTRVGLCRDKRKKLTDCFEDGILPPTPDLDSTNNSKKTIENDKEKTHFWVSSNGQPCSENVQSVGSSNTFSPDVSGNYVHKKPSGRKGSPSKTNAAQMSPELSCQNNEVDSDEPESFTCQRVRVFKRTVLFSCARTYMSWPFTKCSWTLTANAGTSAQSAEHVDDRKEEEDGKCILAERNGTTHDDMSLYSSLGRDMEFAPHLVEAEELQNSLSNPSQYGQNAASPSSSPVNDPKTDSYLSTRSPKALCPSGWKTAPRFSPMSSPFTHSGSSRISYTTSSPTPSVSLLTTVKSVELAEDLSANTLPVLLSPSQVVQPVPRKSLMCDEESQMTRCHNSESYTSFGSFHPITQEEQESDEELLADRFPPKLEPYYKTSPVNHDLVFTENNEDMFSNDFVLLPVLSPVISPTPHFPTTALPQSPVCLDEEEEEINEEPNQHKSLPGCFIPHIVYGNNGKTEDDLVHRSKHFERISRNLISQASLSEQSFPSSDEDLETDDGEHFMQVDKKSEEVSSGSKITPGLDAQAKSCSSSCSDKDDYGAFSDKEQPCLSREELIGPCKRAGPDRAQVKAKAAGDTHQSVWDEFTAFEQDILLVDVIQDDPELFENMPQKSLLKLGPTRISEVLKTRKGQASVDVKKRLTPVNIVFQYDSPDIKDESNSRSWRPQSVRNPATRERITWTAKEKPIRILRQPDANNNHVNGGLERSQPIQTVISLHNHTLALKTPKNGSWNTNLTDAAELRRQQSNAYCRQYFSESLSCGFNMCWFLHVPGDGDEKFCIETVTRFTKNPVCLQKAGAVFTGYYQNNPPGVYFSMPVLLSLLWALLKAGMLSDVFSVLSVSSAHKIVPGHEFVLALFNFVREKSLLSLVPELMQLTFKMASAGLVLSSDCLDCVKNTPEFQKTNSNVSVSDNQKMPTSGPFPENLKLVHAIVEIELCTKQKDWRQMGEVFRSICQSSQRPNQVERISGRIAIALLSESKDKLSLPFAAFAETVSQNEEEESLSRSFLGRIGVSLMLRYHKTHQWAKGRKVVEVLSSSKVNYSLLKGLFGNEDGASRCCLVTVATELFLLSGSVEGALNTLRENKWFVSSCSWPCEPADLESRIRVLARLAEKSSHRDSFDILSNLPGLKETSNSVDISRYASQFNFHLQVCLDRQMLPVASDTVDFMLSKNLAVDPTMLHMLLDKLGKQNLWHHAREIFRHALSAEYYPGVSAPPGFFSLIIPCRLGEVELALTLEMYITVNATVLLHQPENTSSCLSITLKRTQSCESEYLSAGSRLLSASCIPQPKLIIHYKYVNASQEQVFTLDIPSARFWLRHNHRWANEVWTH